MKLTLEQRTKLFKIVRETILVNIDKIKIISSDYPNLSLMYEDDNYRIVYFYNQFRISVSTNDCVLISLMNKEIDSIIRFDSGDYIFMKNWDDMHQLIEEINEKIFQNDNTDQCDTELINKILDI